MADNDVGIGGGTPPLGPVGGPSLEDEEKAMHSGRWRMMTAMIVAVVLAVGALVWYMGSGGEDEAYATFGRNINGLGEKYFDQFWGCALRGTDLRNLHNDQDLRDNINLRAQQGGKAYADHVREQCLPMLGKLDDGLTKLLPPTEMQKDFQAMAASVPALESAWSGYIAYVDGLSGPYDPEAASEKLGKIARGWYDFKRTHASLNKALRSKLQPN